METESDSDNESDLSLTNYFNTSSDENCSWISHEDPSSEDDMCCSHHNTILLLRSLWRQRSDSFILNVIRSGCKVNYRNIHGDTPLLKSIDRPTMVVALELLKIGADINASNVSKLTPVHLAVAVNNLEALCMLLCHGADVNIASEDGNTPLKTALEQDRSDIGCALINFYDKDEAALVVAAYPDRFLAQLLIVDLVKDGIDVNHLNEQGSNALSLAIMLKSADTYKLVWPQFNHDNLPKSYPPILFHYVYNCEFPLVDWLQCIYQILGTTVVSELMRKDKTRNFWDTDDEYLILELLKAFENIGVELEDRLAIINIFLSYGVKVNIETIEFICQRRGFNEEVEAIIYGTDYFSGYNRCNFLLSRFIYAANEDPTTEEIWSYFRSELLNIDEIVDFERSARHNIYLLSFFFIPTHIKQELLNALEVPEYYSKVMSLPEIPSLVEISRNQARRFVRQSFRVQKPYRFYEAVKKFHLPKIIEDILVYKKPLYYIK